MIKFAISWVSFMAAMRTAGALMFGNAFVGFFFFNKGFSDLWALGVSGLCVIVLSSLEIQREP